MERCTDRNQITHPHFTIFAPISPGHSYFHSILRNRMKQNNMIAVNQVMPSSLCMLANQYHSDTQLKPIWTKYLVASQYISHLNGGGWGGGGGEVFIINWKSPKKHSKSPNTYKRIKSTYRLPHHILPCNIPILWTFSYQSASIILTLPFYLCIYLFTGCPPILIKAVGLTCTCFLF